MGSEEAVVGVDVGKFELACSVNGRAHVLANSDTAIEQWLSELPSGSVIGMEATGAHHLLLAGMAHAAGMRVYVLNPRDVSFYAKALGKRGKTDSVDADTIARYVAEHHQKLHSWSPASAGQQQIQELVRRRAGVTSHRASLRQMLSGMKELRDSFTALEEQFTQLLADIDVQIRAAIRADADMKEASDALQTITGIKLQGSALLISLLSRIPFANVNAFIAYSGLDPRPNDSGRRRGTRVLSKKGPPELRRQMYLAAFSAVRSKTFRPIYDALLTRGFKTTEAFVILARKIMRIAWAVWKTRKPFNPQLVNQKLA